MDHEPELDDVTTERLLEGAVHPDDAPPSYQAVARTLQSAAALAAEVPADGADSAVAAFLHAVPTRRNSMITKWKLATAALAGGLVLSTGLAAAGALPGAAQSVASDALAKVGISVPDNSDTHAGSRGRSADHTATHDQADTSTTRPENHGSVVSNVAHDDSNVGVDHGAAVCTAASQGNCQAGQHGQAGQDHPGTTVTTVAHSNGASVHSGSSNSSGGSANNSNGGGSTNSSGGAGSSSGGSGTSSGASTGSGNSANSSTGSTGSTGN
jgi:hypothetical protein